MAPIESGIEIGPGILLPWHASRSSFVTIGNPEVRDDGSVIWQQREFYGIRPVTVSCSQNYLDQVSIEVDHQEAFDAESDYNQFREKLIKGGFTIVKETMINRAVGQLPTIELKHGNVIARMGITERFLDYFHCNLSKKAPFRTRHPLSRKTTP